MCAGTLARTSAGARVAGYQDRLYALVISPPIVTNWAVSSENAGMILPAIILDAVCSDPDDNGMKSRH